MSHHPAGDKHIHTWVHSLYLLAVLGYEYPLKFHSLDADAICYVFACVGVRYDMLMLCLFDIGQSFILSSVLPCCLYAARHVEDKQARRTM